MKPSTALGTSAAGTVLPPSDPTEVAELSRFLARHAEALTLRGSGGEQIRLSAEIREVLLRAVAAMRNQQAVTVVPLDRRLTTQQAADLLGISRPTLIKMIERGDLRAEVPTGTRHRRLLLSEVLDYQRRRADERRDLMTKLVQDAEEDGLYGVPAERFQAAAREVRAARAAERS